MLAHACTNSFFAAAFTESPAAQTGAPAMFTFTQTQNLYGETEPTGNSIGGDEFCVGAISDANGNSVTVQLGLGYNIAAMDIRLRLPAPAYDLGNVLRLEPAAKCRDDHNISRERVHG
jgi:hypothetical protein